MPSESEPDLDPALKAKMGELHHSLTQCLGPKLDALFLANGFPANLCHYTSFEGLKGILETGRLWATYARVLNDSTEYRYGSDVVLNYIRKSLPHQTCEDVTRAIAEPRRNFVTCFCESSTVLGMWRGYGSFGGGYCLEFEGRGLLGCSFPPYTRLPFKITYGNALPHQLRGVLDVLSAFAVRGQLEAIISGGWLSVLALGVKHSAFAEEAEWRFVVQDPQVSELKFRCGHSDIKPYIELGPVMVDRTKRLPLKRIVFGPTLRNDDALFEGIGLMLERYGYSGIRVESSGIPYRL